MDGPARGDAFKTIGEARYAVPCCGVLGLVIPAWVITTYAAEDDLRAIIISLLIMGGFAFSIAWLWYYAWQFARQARELRTLDATLPPERQLQDLSPGLARLVSERLSGGQAAHNGTLTTFIPYAIGALVLVGLIGTLIGLVDTLAGTRQALETTSELEALRSALLAPIAGLARAFGTSLSGVASSLILGLAATLTRREEARVDRLIAGLLPGRDSPLHPVTRQTLALEQLVEQGAALPKVLAEFRGSMVGLNKTLEEGLLGLADGLEEGRQDQERTGRQIAGLIGEQLAVLRGDLASQIKRVGDQLEPALKAFLAHTAAFLGEAGDELMAKIQTRLEATAAHDLERRTVFLDLIEQERHARGSEELAHFERLTAHAQSLSDALHGHVQGIGEQYSGYLSKLEQRMGAFDQDWRSDRATRIKEHEQERLALEGHLAGMRRRFVEACEEQAERHRALLERMAAQSQELVSQFERQTSSIADPKVLAELRGAVEGLSRAFEEGRRGQERLGSHIAAVINQQVGVLRGDLASDLKHLSDRIEPALKSYLAEAAAFLDQAGHELMAKVESRLEATAALDQERRNALLELLASERRNRGAEEVTHFERLMTHAKAHSDALHEHVQAIGQQYSSYLSKLEQRMAAFDEAWRTDSAGRRKEHEKDREILEAHLAEIRQRFVKASEGQVELHRALLGRMAAQSQELAEQLVGQTASLADQAAKAVAEVSAMHHGILEKHEDDRQQLRKAWGIEQGRQQRQFDSVLEKIREDLDDRRRNDAEQLARFDAWAEQLVERMQHSVGDKADVWDQRFSQLIASLAETSEALNRGEIARTREFREIAEIIAAADRHRAEELGRLFVSLRAPSEEALASWP